MCSKYSGSATTQPPSMSTSTPPYRAPSSIHENIQPSSYPTRPFLPDTSKIIIEDPELPHFRSLEHFTSGKEVLIALRDSIIVHREAYILSNTNANRSGSGAIATHGRISPAAVCLPDPNAGHEKYRLSDARSFLAGQYVAAPKVKPTSSKLTTPTQELFSTRSPSTSLVPTLPLDPRFQSVNTLLRTTFPLTGLRRSPRTTFALDYTDDLESYWYVLAYLSMGFSAPKVNGAPNGPHYTHLVPHPKSNEAGGKYEGVLVEVPHRALASWALDPTSREAILEKEALLKGAGFSFGNTTKFWNGFVVEKLLDEMHEVLKQRHGNKLDAASHAHASWCADEWVWPWEDQLKACNDDYKKILVSFDEAISLVDYVEKHTYTDEERRKVIQEMAESCQPLIGGEEDDEDDEDSLEYTTSDEYTTGSEDGASTDRYSPSGEADSVVLPFVMTARRVAITKY